MKQMLSLVFAILSANVVYGQRCLPNIEWEDMGPDGCINFMARSWSNSFSQAGIDCTSFEHGGRYAQLMRYRDSSQAAADASFDALYAKFVEYKSALGDYAWVNVYRGGGTAPNRLAHMHGYDTWLKTTLPYTKQYTPYSFLPQDGAGLIRWGSGEPNSESERCYELMIDGGPFSAGLNDENCGDQLYYPCQMYASCTSAERQVEFGCECDDSKAYTLNGVCTMCPHAQATAGVCFCNGGSYRSTTEGVVSCIQCARGEYAGGGATACEECSAGSYMEYPGGSYCNLCDAGTYSIQGSATCTPCAAGDTAQYVGSQTCSTCLAGTYAASADQACVSCEVGKSQRIIGQVSCEPCDAGTYQDTRGKTSCIDCRATEVSNEGAVSCTACPPGEEYLDTSTESVLRCQPCQNGYYADLETDTCMACEWNQRSQVPVGDACVPCDPWAAQDLDGISCTRCLAGQYYNRNIRTCSACDPGSYSEDFNIAPACTPCPSFTAWSGLNSRAWTNVATDGAGDEIGGTKASDCQCLPHLTAYEYEDVTLCLCGRGQFMRSENDSACEPAARGVYQPSVHRTVNKTEALPYVHGGATLDLTDNQWSLWSEQLECPYGSTTAAEASETIDDCKCAGGRDPTPLAPRTSVAWRESSETAGQLLNQASSDIAFALEPVTLPRFRCPCDVGEYLTPVGCALCKGCDGGEYMTNCGGLSEGHCVPCEQCADVNGEKMMRVGCISREGRTDKGGECKPERVVVRTPLCPEDVEDAFGNLLDIQTQLGLGGFSFVSAFSKDEEDVDFACSRECRGDDTGDQGQCDGPFACNVKTCLQQQGDYTVTRPLPPTMVCPVYMTTEESHDFWTYEAAVEAKRRERCVACSDCGHQHYEERVGLYDHWGAGCARECSLHLCPLKSNDIFDWTDGVCKACTELRDGRLCSASDAQRLRIQETGMTGNLPFLTFVGCAGRAEGFDHVQYGRCELCESVTCEADEFEASCHAPQCQKCDRSRAPAVAGLRQVWRSENGEEVPLYCQISACLEAGRTGVRDHGPVCEAECGETGLCGAEEVEIACLLPHDTRCESVWPPRGTTQRVDRIDVGDEVNLLNEPVEAEERHRFASFENTLINLGATEHEYQCVWNAAGILDNSAKPGGVSAVLFAPGHAYAEEYRDRGTKACRQWRRLLDVEYPLLPLQNTIALRTEATRRMAVNVEAHVVSYRYDGFGVDGTAALQQVGRLDGVHQGGVGDLFLVLNTRGARDAVVSVALPRDRNMANATWLRSVLVSFAVADVTRADDTLGASDRPRATAYVKLQKAQGSDASDADLNDLSAERVARKVVSPWPSDHASYTLSASREAQQTLTHLTNFSGQWRTFSEAHWVGSSPLELKAGGAVDAYVLTDAARLRGAYDSAANHVSPESDGVLRALHVLGGHVSVNKHVSNARDRFELAGVQVNVDVAVSGLRHAQLVPSGSRGSRGSNACTLLAATALEVWCLRFTRAEQYSVNAAHMQHAMQKIVALPAGGVTRIVGVSSAALGGADDCVHLVLACERCLDAEAGAENQVADADDRSGTLLWCRGNCTELVETECEHCSHFLSIAGFENPGNEEAPNTLLAVEFAAVTGGLVLRLGEYGVRNVSALRQEFGGVDSIFVSDVSVTPRMNVTDLGTVKATELPWLRGCRVARQSHSEFSGDSGYSEATMHVLTVCAVRETAADGAQTLVLRAWLLRRWAEPVAGGSVVVATSAASFDMASFVSVEFLHMSGGSSSWLVAYGADTADHQTYVCAASRVGVRFTRQVVSDFAQQHFVRGGAYFYALPVTSTGLTRQMNVVGYLPEFERSPKNESRVFHAYAAFMPGERAVFKTLPARRFAGSAHATAVDESQYAALFGAVNETASTLALFDNQSGVVQRVGLPAALDEQHVQDSSQTTQTMPTMRRLLEHIPHHCPDKCGACDGEGLQVCCADGECGMCDGEGSPACCVGYTKVGTYAKCNTGVFFQQTGYTESGCADECTTRSNCAAYAWGLRAGGRQAQRTTGQCELCSSAAIQDCTSDYYCGDWVSYERDCVPAPLQGCDGVNNSGFDSCGVCDGDNSTCAGCDGVPDSGKVLDACGVCDGDNSTCAGCDGVAFSGKVLDACGVCDGNNSCFGCDGVPNSGKVLDACDVCDGDDACVVEYVLAFENGCQWWYTNTETGDSTSGPGVMSPNACRDLCTTESPGSVYECAGYMHDHGSSHSPGHSSWRCRLCRGPLTNSEINWNSYAPDGSRYWTYRKSIAGCDGVRDSYKVNDACGVCDGNGSSCAGCDGAANSNKTNDACGVCDGDNACVGCDGVANSGKVLDGCAVCDGDNSSCAGCDGVPNSGKVLDACGVCDGDNSSCAGCDGVPDSGKVNDVCNVCDGDNTTCRGCDGVPNSGIVLDPCQVCGGDWTSCVEYALISVGELCGGSVAAGDFLYSEIPEPACRQACTDAGENCVGYSWNLQSGYYLGQLIWTQEQCVRCFTLDNLRTATNQPDVHLYQKLFLQPGEGCDGVIDSGKTIDVCGKCDGDNSTCAGCDGVPNSGNTFDICGVCGGDNTTCGVAGCDGVNNSGKVDDVCGMCDGGNSTLVGGCCVKYPLNGGGVYCVYGDASDTNTEPGVEVGVKTFAECAASCTAYTDWDCAGFSITQSYDTGNCILCQQFQRLNSNGLYNTYRKECHPPSVVGCDGLVSSGKVFDVCGVCDGNNSTCAGCDGVPYSNKTNDACGVCDGENLCMGCDDIPYGKSEDLCGVCGGDGNSCRGCDGVLYSNKTNDACGVCGGDNLCMGCDGVLNSGRVFDACDVCGGDGNSCRGCDDVQNSGAVLDVCGVCGGDESTCRDCDGVLNSGKKPDRCGVCDGDNSTCAGCDGVPNSGQVLDACDICGGDNSTCVGCDGVPKSGLERDECGVCGGNNAECCPPNQYWQFAEREWSQYSPDWGTTCATNAQQIETYELFREQGVPLISQQTKFYCQKYCDRILNCEMIYFNGFDFPFSCFICEGNATNITYAKNDFTFKPANVIQNQGCRDCPGNSSSPWGSKAITTCVCNENFAGPAGGLCVPLPLGCDGAVNSGKTNDVCGVCDGDGTSCDGCDGVPNSGLVVDVCDICGGDNSSCAPLPPQDPRRQLSLKPVAFSASDADRVWVLDFELQCGASVENSFGEATWGRWQHECTGTDTDTANVVMVAKYVRDAKEASGPAGLMARAYYTHSAGCGAGSDSSATRVEQNCSLSRLHNASAVAAAVRVWPADADRKASALAEMYVTQISMSGGAQLVSAQEVAEEPTWHEVAATLQEDMSTPDTLETVIRGKQRATRPVAVRPAWQRVRRLFDGGALRSGFGGLFEDGVRLDVHVQRPEDDVESELMVGVDDVQVSPVLTRHPELLSERNSRLGLETVLYVPTAAELGQIGLAHLLRGRDNETLAEELNGAGHHWARIHVTVGVEAHLQMAGCEVEIKLMDLTADGAVSDAFAAPTGTLGRVGCFLRMTRLQAGSEDAEDSEDVEGPAGTVYDECQVEVPVDAAHDYTHQQVGLRAEIRTAATADPSACSVQDASLVGYLRAHTALYECPTEHFYAYDEGRCVHCHAELDVAHVQSCSAGTRLRGCPALEAARVCVDCVHGASLVASQRAHWLPNVPGAVCNWACDAEYYYSEFEATCVVCTNRTTCQVGQRWQACTNTTDAQCASCPNLRAIKGRFGDNEEYVEYVASDVNEECQTACKEGHFRSEDGLCRRCSTLTEVLELALSDGAGFYRFSACNQSSDAVAYGCDAVEGSEASAHAGDFGLDCPRTCAAGWHQTDDGCEQCVWPRQVPRNDTQAVQTIFFQPPYPEAWEAVETRDSMLETPFCCEGTTQTCEDYIDPGSVAINTDASETSPFIPAHGPRTMRITWSDVHWKIARYNILLIVISTTEASHTWRYSAAMSGPEETLSIGEHNKHKFVPANDVTIATGYASFPGFDVLDGGSNSYRIYLQRSSCDGTLVAGRAEHLSDFAYPMRPADAPKNPRHTVKDGFLHVMWDRVPSQGRGFGDPPPTALFTYFGHVFEVRHGEYTYYYDCPVLPSYSAAKDQSMRDGLPVYATSAPTTSAVLHVRCFHAYERDAGYDENENTVELAIAPVNANIAVRTAAKTHCCVGLWSNWSVFNVSEEQVESNVVHVSEEQLEPLPVEAFAWSDPGQTCAFTCAAPYVSTESRPYNYTDASCVRCNASVCAVGTYLTGWFCDRCATCDSTYRQTVESMQTVQEFVDQTLNVSADSSNQSLIEFGSAGVLDGAATCEEQCVEGFYAPFGNLAMGCLRHSVPVCETGFWLRAGGRTHDARCERCRSCEGQMETRECSENADSVCVSCGAVEAPKKWIHKNCTLACEDDLVLDVRRSVCEVCEYVCTAGFHAPFSRDNCTHCEPCTQRIAGSVFLPNTPNTANTGVEVCLEECEEGYELQNATCVIKLSVDVSDSIDEASGCQGSRCQPGEMCYFGACALCSDVPKEDRPVSDALPAEDTEGLTGAAAWHWVTPYRECVWACTDTTRVKFLHPGGHMSCEPPSVFEIQDESFVDEEDTDAQRRAEEARESDHRMLAFVGVGVLGCLVFAVVVSVIVKCVLKTRRAKRKALQVDGEGRTAQNTPNTQNAEVWVDI